MLNHALVAFAFSGSILLGPPPTAVDPVVDVVHGVEIVDDYRWLETLESDSEQVREWTTRQNEYARHHLDDLPGRAKLEKRLEKLMTLPTINAPVMRMNRYFYRERNGHENQAVLYLREGHDGRPRALLDPNMLDEAGLISLDWFAPNHDGNLIAFGISYAGDENSTLHVMDVDSGRWLADEIPGKVRGVNWRPDSSGFFYRSLADIDNPYSGRIRYHRLGRHHRHDSTLFEQYKEGPLATTWGPFASVSKDGRWMILGYYTSTKSNDLWVVDLDRWLRTGAFVPAEIIVGDDSTSGGPVVGDTLFMRTTMDAPNGRVFSVDLNDPTHHWEEIIPQRDDAVLRGLSLARGHLVAAYERAASTILEVFRPNGDALGEIKLPGFGSARIVTAEDRTEAFFSFTSFDDPTSIWRVDLADRRRELWAQPEVPFDPASLEVKQAWYPSADGTSISMFIVHRRDLPLDGNNPTLLTGYGGFNISLTPRFTATRIPWLEAGGVLAVPNLRGGGEYGERWHEAGMLSAKQNVFDDFIAAAEYLIAQGYTNPQRLAIAGGSNGGLLIGAVVTQRPQLFAAAVCAVPLLDMLRYHEFLMARYWVPEYGDPDVAEHFAWLHAYSPYHNVVEGTRYPAILFTAGENDARVHPLHARKMAAKLQAVAGNDFETDPILLWVERAAGHGAGKPLWLRIRDTADIWSFIMWQTGMAEESDQPSAISHQEGMRH
ncbi:MAG: prolyl oligopeptidase family serine peptidase [Planctomycetota bacterium]|jgi:prolyl oligopeptidase